MSSVTPQSARSTILTVAEVIDETTDAKSFVFDIPADGARFTDYRPGQFLTLRIPSDRTGSVARCYSLASSPATDTKPKVTVKRTDGGYASHWLCDNISVGSKIEVLAPSGVFTPAKFDTPILLLAAGSGITPVISILKAVLHHGNAPVHLVYANRSSDDVIFADELTQLLVEYAPRLSITQWLETERGLPSTQALAEVTRELTEYTAFMCGPTGFMDAAHAALADNGFPHSQVHAEIYNSLAGDPFADVEVAEVTDEQIDAAAHVSVGLDGAVHELTWPRNQTLVDIMLTAGLDVPYSCREGECGSCACTVVDGSVSMDNTGALDPDDIADGYILGCQARPTSDELTIEF